MRTKLSFFALAASLPVFPALASVPVPTPSPEAGAGLAGLALLSAGYTWLRMRSRRG